MHLYTSLSEEGISMHARFEPRCYPRRWPVRGAVYQLFFKGRRKRKKGLNALLLSREQRVRGSNMLQMFPHGVGNGGAIVYWVQSTLHKFHHVHSNLI